MGETCHPRNVLTLLAALERCLTAQGVKVAPGAGVAAANASYAAA
jgi:aspartate aminotransferase-like enzyme